MPSVIQWGGFDSAFSQPMTRRFERPIVGARPVVDGTAQKTASKKLFITPNGPPPEGGPPLRYGAYGVRIPRRRHDPIFSPRVDHIAHLSRPERQRCSWGASRESDGRAAAQPPYACTRTEKVPWRRCSCVHLAAPRCPRRPPAWPGHRSRRQNSQQRKTGSYTALPVVTSWPPCPRRHSVEPPLTAPSAAMLSAHYA